MSNPSRLAFVRHHLWRNSVLNSIEAIRTDTAFAALTGEVWYTREVQTCQRALIVLPSQQSATIQRYSLPQVTRI
jgi:hypothetical protein